MVLAPVLSFSEMRMLGLHIFGGVPTSSRKLTLTRRWHDVGTGVSRCAGTCYGNLCQRANVKRRFKTFTKQHSKKHEITLNGDLCEKSGKDVGTLTLLYILLL